MLDVFTVVLPCRNTGNLTSLFPHQPQQTHRPHQGLCGCLGLEEPDLTTGLCGAPLHRCNLLAGHSVSSLVPLFPWGYCSGTAAGCAMPAGDRSPLSPCTILALPTCLHAWHVVRLTPLPRHGRRVAMRRAS